LLSVVNLIDVFLVVWRCWIVIVKNPLSPITSNNVVVVENPGRKSTLFFFRAVLPARGRHPPLAYPTETRDKRDAAFRLSSSTR
jgi:hypothetical protein